LDILLTSGAHVPYAYLLADLNVRLRLGKGGMVRDEWVGTSETDPISVDFLPNDEVGTPGRLGMTFAPGMWAGSVRGRWERDLAAPCVAIRDDDMPVRFIAASPITTPDANRHSRMR
jgi:hypothetical protein